MTFEDEEYPEPEVVTKAVTKTSTSKKVSQKKPRAKQAPVVTPILSARVYRFDQWAARRGVAQRHTGGLRAYVRDVHKPRTLEEWDKCFVDY